MIKVVKIRKTNKLNEAGFANPFDEEGTSRAILILFPK